MSTVQWRRKVFLTKSGCDAGEIVKYESKLGSHSSMSVAATLVKRKNV
jgi:hypothetical protein